MNAKKVLVVEDNPVSAAVESLVLKSAGYTVIGAKDAAAALAAAHHDRPDLVVLDLGLPTDDPFAGTQWDGFAIMEWFSRIEEPKVPIIVLTSQQAKGTKERCLAAGAVAFLLKPVKKEVLLSTVRAALGESGAPSFPTAQP